MKRTILSLAFLCLTSSAWAVDAPAPDGKAMAEWQLYMGAQGHFAESIENLMKSYQALKADDDAKAKEIEALKADAKPKDVPAQ